MDATKVKDVRRAAQEAARAPIKVFRLDDVSASVFASERVLRGEPVTFHTVSFSRSYLGSDGKRRYTKTFDLDDLERIAHLAQEAGEYVSRLRQPVGR
jgi:hypothetical protein